MNSDIIKDKLLKVKAVLFDLDGTLIDSMGVWKQIDIDYLARFGMEYEEGLQEALGGKNFDETALYFQEHFGIKASAEQMKSDWNEMAEYAYGHTIDFKAGAKKLLIFCREKGIKTAVVTTNSKRLVNAVIAGLNLDRYIDVFVTADDIKKGKPEPDAYLSAAKKLGVSTADCIVFEDIIEGIMSGKNAGIYTVAVYDSYSEKNDEQKRQLADAYLEDFNDVC